MENLKNSKIFVSHGLNDATVAPGFAQLTEKYFSRFLSDSSQIEMLTELPANHAVMTNGRGTQCGTANPPIFIEDCGFESIQAMFEHLYENMEPPKVFGGWTGKLLEFSQNDYFEKYASQDEIGYYYMPKNCELEGAKCLLHVYFHGCTMGASNVGLEFMTQSGLLEMADANDIVLILPQVNMIWPKNRIF